MKISQPVALALAEALLVLHEREGFNPVGIFGIFSYLKEFKESRSFNRRGDTFHKKVELTFEGLGFTSPVTVMLEGEKSTWSDIVGHSVLWVQYRPTGGPTTKVHTDKYELPKDFVVEYGNDDEHTWKYRPGKSQYGDWYGEAVLTNGDRSGLWRKERPPWLKS